ncbi:nitrite reductase small subunit NirD [Streptomyces cavernae]|uniref:nitrite reductase small subunit NirD n=1 Tax=Streptomyces cavernae TaxID=2259034 RepID=UPI000FEBA7F1|nr:nitrite reductase small subunit NirD [Streptomyces cavernae]
MTLAPETTTLKVQVNVGHDWVTVCDLDRLPAGRGVAALLPDGRQIALFRDRAGRTYGIDNRDPFCGAAVLSRGLTGNHQGRPFVASPLLKQRFDLESGQCLDDPAVSVAVYEVRAV